MKTAALWLLLATGEAATVDNQHPGDCRMVASAIASEIADGKPVSVDLDDGRERVPVTGALCFHMRVSPDPCSEAGA